ncbi:MAG: 50S ribosomal protein L4 [Deltaproteobacteria bacterium]|nr:50S ribosomal protein L4 [Deltaproteobacteria bacterium]
MATIEVLSLDKKKIADLELDSSVFEAPIRQRLFYTVVKRAQAARRRGTHSTKTRHFVSGGGKKPFRQKGTGRARQGTNRSPLMPGGATVFGPLPRSYTYSLPRKVRRAAMRAALSLKVKEGRLRVIDHLDLAEIRTRALLDSLKKLELSKALIVIEGQNEKLEKSARNLQHFKVVQTSGMTLMDVLRYNELVMTRPAYDRIVAGLQTLPAAR